MKVHISQSMSQVTSNSKPISKLKFLGATVVSHDLVDDVSIPVCEGTNCFTRRLIYPTSMTQLDALTNISTYCFQEIQVYS